MNKFIITLCLLSLLPYGIVSVSGQVSYSLQEAIKDAVQSAPSSLMEDIVKNENTLHQKNLKSRFLPQVSLGGQATYQSETTGLDLSLPGFIIPRLSRDQYKMQLDASQLLYDGGATQMQKQIKNTSAEIEVLQAAIDIEMVREQIIQVYFSINEIDAKLQLLQYKKMDISAIMKKMMSGMESGMILKSEINNLKVELLSVEQVEEELKSVRESQINILNILTSRELTGKTTFSMPEEIISGGSSIASKPMLKMLDLQKINLENIRKLDFSLSKPKASLFLQAGYGKPGLNFLKNEFTQYYLGGIRVQWNISNLYTSGRDSHIKKLNLDKLDIKKSAYVQQLDIKIAGYAKELERLKTMIDKDEEIIRLRKEIKNTSSLQLEKGIQTSTDYLIKVNDENEAEINKELHKIQWLKAAYLIQHHTGKY